MKKRKILAAVIIFLFPAMVFAGEKIPQKMANFAQTELVRFGVDPVIVKAVKAENGKKKSIEYIKALDEKWRSTPGTADFMKALTDSECGRHLAQIKKTADYYAEIFVMDNQGALVAMTDKTSDYWQGDEAKFTESFKDGTGGIHIGDVEFDDSTKGYLVQISIPVKDGETVIGAITFGIDMMVFD